MYRCVEEEVMKGPLLGEGELAKRVNEELKRTDITAANIEAALEQISCKAVLGGLRKQMEQGEARYKESYLLEEMRKELSQGSAGAGGLEGAYVGGMKLSDPTAIKKLLMGDVPVRDILPSLGWGVFVMNLDYWNVPLLVLGRWSGVDKSTVLRGIVGLALSLWPMIYGWILGKVKEVFLGVQPVLQDAP